MWCVDVKIRWGRAHIERGALGVGFGAWSRAAKLRDRLRLDALPSSLSSEDWHALQADEVLKVEL